MNNRKIEPTTDILEHPAREKETNKKRVWI